MSNKIRLKEMSHKKLRKLAKQLALELKSVQNAWKADKQKHRELKDTWKGQFDAEVYYKKQALERACNAEDEAYRYKMQVEKDQERIEQLEQYSELRQQIHMRLSTITGWATDCSNGMRLLDGVENLLQEKDKRIAELEHALDALGNGVTMGIDGQLRSFNEMTDVEFATFVAEDVRRAMVEDESDKIEQLEGNCIGHIPKSADVDEAVAWAKRNGHHQPEGHPEPNRMDQVRIKSADKISEENKQKHVDIVCNEIQKDASRILNATEYIDSGHTDKM